MKTLAVMRPKNRIEESKQMAEAAGFNAVCASPVEIIFNDTPYIDSFVNDLRNSKIDFLVITSTNGADAMLSLVSKRMQIEEFKKHLDNVNVVSIGPVSEKALSCSGIHVSCVPAEYSSKGIVDMLSASVSGKSVYILRSDHGDALLSNGLKDAGANVVDIPVYSLLKIKDSDMINLVKKTLAGEIDVFAFTSALSASSFIDAVCEVSDDAVHIINRAKIAAIGFPTKAKLESLGIRVDIVPENATYSCMLDSLSKL